MYESGAKVIYRHVHIMHRVNLLSKKKEKKENNKKKERKNSIISSIINYVYYYHVTLLLQAIHYFPSIQFSAIRRSTSNGLVTFVYSFQYFIVVY